MKIENNGVNCGAVSEWEDDGGARSSDGGRQSGNAPSAGDRRRSPQQDVDASHQSDTRGEHRCDDVCQTGAEQKARKDRDDLNQQLASRPSRRLG